MKKVEVIFNIALNNESKRKIRGIFLLLSNYFHISFLVIVKVSVFIIIPSEGGSFSVKLRCFN